MLKLKLTKLCALIVGDLYLFSMLKKKTKHVSMMPKKKHNLLTSKEIIAIRRISHESKVAKRLKLVKRILLDMKTEQFKTKASIF